jgi:hypothetical protein
LKELKDRQYHLNLEIEEHTKADHDYHIHVSTVFNLCRRIKTLFESSEPSEKRAILNYLLQNPTISSKNLEFTLRKPFNLILELSGCPTGLDMVRDIGTFWKTNKEHIWLPNIKQGFFGITQPTEADMAKYR